MTSDYFNDVRQLEETVDKDAAAAGAQCNTSLKFAQVSPLLTLGRYNERIRKSSKSSARAAHNIENPGTSRRDATIVTE